MKKAVLIIHGFAGGTYDQEKLAFYLELRGFDVYSFTLPGHERTLRKKVTKEEWMECCRSHIEEIIDYGYKQIYVIGHSMGGVLASYLAANYSEVKKLVLAAPAFKYLTFGNENFEAWNAIKNSPKLLQDYKANDIISRMIQFPASVIKEFMNLVSLAQDIPNQITCNTLIIQGTNDKIVPPDTAEMIYNKIKTNKKKIMYLDGVNHDIFHSIESDNVCKEIYDFLNRLL